MLVARIVLFISFTYEYVKHPCALVEWFSTDGDAPDPITGMWVVRPEIIDGERVMGIVHVDSIVRACHLFPVCGNTPIPLGFHFSDTLDAFKAYYVNQYIDFHMHEMVL